MMITSMLTKKYVVHDVKSPENKTAVHSECQYKSLSFLFLKRHYNSSYGLVDTTPGALHCVVRHHKSTHSRTLIHMDTCRIYNYQ